MDWKYNSKTTSSSLPHSRQLIEPRMHKTRLSGLHKLLCIEEQKLVSTFLTRVGRLGGIVNRALAPSVEGVKNWHLLLPWLAFTI